MTIIGITGKAGSGKTTAANVLADRGFKKLSFATPLKEIAKAFGCSGEEDDRNRELYQKLGTDVGRWYDKDIWVKKMAQRILDIEEASIAYQDQTMIVIDDVRFDNEAMLIKKLDGFVIELKGSGYYKSGSLASHASEGGISESLIDYSWDFPFYNSVDEFSSEFKKKINWLIGG